MYRLLLHYGISFVAASDDSGPNVMQNCLAVQIKYGSLAVFDKDEVLACLKESGAEIQVRKGPPDEAYVNFCCWTEGGVLPIWKRLQGFLADQAAIRDVTVVCCTGKNGWDDYLLLHGASVGELLDVL